jgi:agmatine/peptidylarginine deiminase
MKKNYKLFLPFFSIALLAIAPAFAQEQSLPVGFSAEELQQMSRADWQEPVTMKAGITTPPAGPLRTMGQWEEMQAVTITWRSYESVLIEIVRAARKEVTVIINCNTVSGSSSYKDSTAIKSALTAAGVPLSNVRFNPVASNSVWMRDYGPNSVYVNDVDSLVLVDWKYNRPTRPQDDVLPNSLATMLNVPIYETTTGSNLLINTGGNWICDGLGTSFHSNLIVNENPTLSIAQINTILNNFMGITRSIKMDTLPYDGIHHLDMHMKLINEETLLVGQYPAGVSDGPQIEANLAYILANYNSAFGTPYKVVRIPQPPDITGPWTGYPDAGGDYLTYTNATILNKTIIVPQYYTTYDTTALRIWRDNMPGYNVVGINSNSTISASGSLHCITHDIGVSDPLLIVHQNLPNTTNTVTPYQVDARIQHRTGVATATLYYTTDTTMGFSNVPMTLTSAVNNTWTGFIPAYPAGTHVFYYIKAQSVSGKQQVRPMPAPAGDFEFDVLGPVSVEEISNETVFQPAYPNPSHGITCIPVKFGKNTSGSLKLYDMLGNVVKEISSGDFQQGTKNFFINGLEIAPGAYLITLDTREGRISQKLMVR